MTISILTQAVGPVKLIKGREVRDREVKLRLITGQVVTAHGLPKKPTAEEKYTQLRVLIALAKSFGADDLPLSQTPIPFGRFACLTFGQAASLEKGDKVIHFGIYMDYEAIGPIIGAVIQRRSGQIERCRHTARLSWKNKRVWEKWWPMRTQVITTPADGIRYLDYLNGQHEWVYPNTQARIALFLTSPHFPYKHEARLAYTSIGKEKSLDPIADRRMGIMRATSGPVGALDDQLMIDVHGSWGSKSFGASLFDPEDDMLANDLDVWRTHADAVWLLHPSKLPHKRRRIQQGAAFSQLDPTPDTWSLRDDFGLRMIEGPSSSRRQMHNGEEDDDHQVDGWVDQDRIAENDLPDRDADLRPNETLYIDERFSGRTEKLVETEHGPKLARIKMSGNAQDKGRYEQSCPRAWQYGLDAIRDLEAIQTQANEATQALLDWINPDACCETDWNRLEALVEALDPRPEGLTYKQPLYSQLLDRLTGAQERDEWGRLVVQKDEDGEPHIRIVEDGIEQILLRRLGLNMIDRKVSSAVSPKLAAKIAECFAGTKKSIWTLRVVTMKARELLKDRTEVTIRERAKWIHMPAIRRMLQSASA